MTQQKNTINILFKNIFIITIGLLLYCFVGFSLMYPGFTEGSFGLFGFAEFGLIPFNRKRNIRLNLITNDIRIGQILFQGMFAVTASTIVSGAVAERMKLGSFMIFTIIYVGLIYPIAGSWKWGGGFLQTLETPFYDFVGSTLVHSVGGWQL